MIDEFIIFSSGANKNVLSFAPTEKSKFISIGLSVILTSILASISGGYAFFFTFNSTSLSIAFGVLWGCIIFNLDRYIVSSYPSGKLIKKILFIFPRLLISIILAITISKPLELKLFEDSVVRVIKDKDDLKKQSDEDRFNNNKKAILQVIERSAQSSSLSDPIISDINNQINELSEYSNALKRALRKDTTGKTRTLIDVNNRGIYSLRLELNKRKKEVFNKIKLNESVSADKLTGLKKQLREMDSVGVSRHEFKPDILGRLKALSELKEANSTANIASMFITMLFMLIEVSPVLIKLMTDNSIYEGALKEYSNEMIGNNDKIKANNDKMLNYKLIISLKTNQTAVDYLEKKRLYLKKIRIDKWYDRELSKINKKN